MNKDIFLYCSVFILAIFISYFEIFNFSKLIDLFTSNEFKYELQSIPQKNTNEIGLYFIGSSDCRFSNDIEMYESVDEIKYLLSIKAQELRMNFNAVGISTDFEVQDGILYLSKFGNFNQISVGNGWNNLAIQKYITEFNLETSTPILLITKKVYTENVHVFIEEERLIIALIGKDRIMNWLANGANLPAEFLKEFS